MLLTSRKRFVTAPFVSVVTMARREKKKAQRDVPGGGTASSREKTGVLPVPFAKLGRWPILVR
ncbi:hypothetical protein CEE69_16640 [Rhodopirellula bahusiensis]|uniref:Uncharacterized protein n=1 Tax=Rhodopirellula bahusiensis TaxID=2014065 RepID=A0A2G1W613_9BACT|nr:hypothetical protein CEE69_16640 [Rhodopirellula bahusiensis]